MSFPMILLCQADNNKRLVFIKIQAENFIIMTLILENYDGDGFFFFKVSICFDIITPVFFLWILAHTGQDKERSKSFLI